MGYRFLDDIATADVAFEAWGETIEQMFSAAARAAMNVMVADLAAIDMKETRPIALKSEEADMLLFGLLQELIFYKDAEQLLLLVEDIHIGYANGMYTMVAVGAGEPLDPQKHDLLVDVKAVTLHRFKVEQTQQGWETLVVLDI
jgi:SHS2 domain-containing protein